MSSCPDNRGQINRAPPWANLPPGQWVYEFSDYFNACSASVPVPLNWAGNQPAHGGSAYAGLFTGGAQDTLPRSYIQAPLLGSLVAGAPYKVSFYVALAHLSEFASDGIGAYFSTGPVVAFGSSLPAAQITNPTGNILDEHWRLVQGQFIAHGGEDHILIGNFRDAAHTNTAANNNTNGMGMAFYYVDDVSVELQPDLAIEKAVSRSNPQNHGYTFQLTVKSPGAPFNGHGIITVTDYAPPGVSFSGVPTAVNAYEWNCTLTPSTVTCVYVGTGPTAINQTIGTITFSGAANHLPLPPLTRNCARVELYQTSGHVDGNPANNQSCAVLPGQREICAPPMVANPFPPPRCVCPRGTVASGNGCATPVRTCVAPQNRDPKSGACLCPPGKVERNGNCVTSGTNSYCQPPKVPGPTPRSCLCPNGTVAKGGTCVAARQDCKPPKSRDPKSGACLCPQGTQPRGQECMTSAACLPPTRLDARGICQLPGTTVPGMAPRVGPSGPGRTNGRGNPYDKH